MKIKTLLKGKFSSSQKSIVYVSFFVALSIDANKLFASFHPEIQLIADIPWVFNLFEFLYQVIYSWIYYAVFGLLLFSTTSLNQKRTLLEKLKVAAPFLLFFIIALLFGLLSQLYFFDNLMNSKIYRSSVAMRFVIGSGLIYVLVRFLRIAEDRKMKALENERLKSENFDAQLKNLRAQINPHFFFNALANLSSLMREDVPLAQKYVGNLAKVFRYSLTEFDAPLVELSKELESLSAQVDLLLIRYEDSINISIDIEEPHLYELPVMSLQPLLENVTKHTVITAEKPSTIAITVKKDQLYFYNTIAAEKQDVPSNGIGLFNLNERFKMLMQKEITIKKTAREFLVILPLIKKNA